MLNATELIRIADKGIENIMNAINFARLASSLQTTIRCTISHNRQLPQGIQKFIISIFIGIIILFIIKITDYIIYGLAIFIFKLILAIPSIDSNFNTLAIRTIICRNAMVFRTMGF